MELKIEIPHTVLERRTLCLTSYNNCKSKVKLWWDGACERKKRAYFVPCILSEGNFFNICGLSQYIVYWLRFHNIHAFTYQKQLLHTFFCLFLKSSKAFSVPLIFHLYNIWTNWRPDVIFSIYAIFFWQVLCGSRPIFLISVTSLR